MSHIDAVYLKDCIAFSDFLINLNVNAVQFLLPVKNLNVFIFHWESNFYIKSEV